MKKFASLVLTLAMLVVGTGFLPAVAMAASLTTLSDTLSTVKTGIVANHTIVFTTPTGIAAAATLVLTFDNSTSIPGSFDFQDMDLKDDGVDVTLAGTPSGATWGAVRTSGTVITFTNGSGAVAAGSVVTILLGTNASSGGAGVHQITNGSVGTTKLVFSGSFGDTGTLAMAIIANDVVSVTATVDPTISFSLGSNSVGLGTLTTGAAGTGSHTVSAATNASGGFSITYNGDTLKSGANSIAAYSSAISSPGTAGFGINLKANATPSVGANPTTNAGTCGIAANYNTANTYHFVANTATAITSVTTPSDCVYTTSYVANISSTTPAGSYSTSLTYVATGNF
jgi:hypothetical protein